MNESSSTFSDLFEEIKFEIFKYLDLNEKIKLRYVSRDWWSILSRILSAQGTVAIGQPDYDSNDRMKLSLCNINSGHTVTPFNTITNDLTELMWNGGADRTNDAQKFISRLLKSFKRLRSVFVYAAIQIKLSDLPDTIEHIHFGHNVENAIVFDRIEFPQLTCISTIDAHLGENYLRGITDLLRTQKLQLKNVSVCEVPRSLCEQIVEMRHLKQLYVFDFQSDFHRLYKEKNLEIMDAHPELQHFNMFVLLPVNLERVCPTETVRWLVEFGSATNSPLNRQFLIDVFDTVPFTNTLEFAKEYVHGLHLLFLTELQTTTVRYTTKLNSLKNLRLSYRYWTLKEDDVRQSIEHHLSLAPNVENFQLRIFADGIFEKKEWMTMIFGIVCSYAAEHPHRTIRFELSSFGEMPDDYSYLPCLPKNLNVILKSLEPQ